MSAVGAGAIAASFSLLHDPRVGIVAEIAEAARESAAPDFIHYSARTCATTALGGVSGPLVATAAALLAGCGTMSAPMPTSQAFLASAMATKSTKVTLDHASFNYGQQVGRAKYGTPMLTAAPAPTKINQYSYDFGRVVGYLEGAEDCYNNLSGSFNADQWKNFADQQYDALVAAEKLIEQDNQLETNCGVALGIIKGGISSYNNLNGSFNSDQWKNFADTNYQNVAQAIIALLRAEGQ